MKYFFRYNSRIPKIFQRRAIVLYPFVFIRFNQSATPPETIRHEYAHLAQCEREGVLKFYGNYLYQYFKNRLAGFNHQQSYEMISYEKEAMAEEAKSLP